MNVIPFPIGPAVNAQRTRESTLIACRVIARAQGCTVPEAHEVGVFCEQALDANFPHDVVIRHARGQAIAVMQARRYSNAG